MADKISIARSTLIEVAKKTLAIAKRFVAELTPRGITQAFIDKFEADIQTTSDMKTNKQLDSEATAMTTTVKGKCKQNYKWYKKVKNSLERKFGKDSAEVKELPGNMSDIKTDEKEMINTMPQVIAVDTKYETDLAPYGVIPADGKALLADLDKLNDDQEQLKKDHEAYRTARNLAHLNLYNTTNEINCVGREKFENDPVNLAYFKSPWTGKKGKGEEEVIEPNPPAPGQ